jgi:DNA-binding IclR family transcriptional regulator
MRALGATAPVYAVPALEKGLDLLELLSAAAAPQSQAEIARKLGRSPGEIFRMLNCLERRGWIGKEEGSGRYHVTLKLYELAHAHTPVEQLLRASARPMRELARALRESVHLSVLSRGKLVVLAQEESPEPRRLSIEVGGRFPPVRTASGRLLLAHLAKEDLDEILSGDADFRALGPAERKRLLSGLLDLRRAGVSSAESESIVGVRDVAVLVGNPRVGVTAALCVPSLGLIDRKRSKKELLALLRRAAERITRSLGLGRA